MDFEYSDKTTCGAIMDWAATSIIVGTFLSLFIMGLGVVYLTIVLKQTAFPQNFMVYCWLMAVGFSFIANFIIMAKERNWIRF